MEFKTEVAKIVGRSKEDLWGQVFQSNNLFLVVEVTAPPNHEAAPLGKEIINTISFKFDKLSIVNLKNLKSLVKLESGGLSSLPIPEGAEVNVVLCALVNSVFYLIVLGQGKAILKRREKMATLLEKEGSGSGILKNNDLLILSSPKFDQIISLETLKSTLDQFPPQEIAENLAPLIHSQENFFGAAAIIIRSRFPPEADPALRGGVRGSRPEKEKKVPILGFLSKAKSLTAPLKSFLRTPSFILKRRVSEEERTKRTVLTVALILTGLLFASIIFGFGKKQKSAREEKFQAVFETASHKFEEGKALLSLNTQKSRELLNEAKKVLEAARDEFGKGSKERRKVETLLEQIETALKEAEKVYKLAEAPLFFDPVFLKDKAFGEDLALYKDSLAILDKKQNTLYYLTLKEKKGKILAGGEELAGSKVVGIHGDKVYVLSDGGIVGVGVQGSESRVEIKKDEDWSKIIDLVAYRGNVYVLDKKGKILKYLKTDEGFAQKSYLGPGTEVDFSSASSMAIDGEIWVGKSNEILRFSLGARKEFLPEGLEKGFGSQLLIYTDEECENLYILDKGEQRIVVLNKEGEYQAQYEWEKLASADDMVVSEKERKILVLVEGKIYNIEIK
ncbi:hypothetical protein ISS86_02740 [Candidatus Microgenomates bacterium]|nr:hypothetical protein [Candidatus Microgenomates bacterium]